MSRKVSKFHHVLKDSQLQDNNLEIYSIHEIHIKKVYTVQLHEIIKQYDTRIQRSIIMNFVGGKQEPCIDLDTKIITKNINFNFPVIQKHQRIKKLYSKD